jgi:hypothetical protein
VSGGRSLFNRECAVDILVCRLLFAQQTEDSLWGVKANAIQPPRAFFTSHRQPRRTRSRPISALIKTVALARTCKTSEDRITQLKEDTILLLVFLK